MVVRGSCGGKRDPDFEGGSVGGASGGGGRFVGGWRRVGGGGGGGTATRSCASAGARVGVGLVGAGQVTCEGATAAWACSPEAGRGGAACGAVAAAQTSLGMSSSAAPW